jgi:hypothetical protein
MIFCKGIFKIPSPKYLTRLNERIKEMKSHFANDFVSFLILNLILTLNQIMRISII